MRVVIQRVAKASVSNEVSDVNSINEGLLIFLGIEIEDNNDDITYLVNKISKLRIFDDSEGVMNLSITDINGEIMVISQFTLHAETKKGNRPSYIKAARSEISIPLYDNFTQYLEQETGLVVKSGWFGAHMQVSLVNDGPVTILIDSKSR